MTSASNVLGNITARILRNASDRFSSQRHTYTVVPDANQAMSIVEQAPEAPLERQRTTTEIAHIHHSSNNSLADLSNLLQELGEVYPEESRTPEDSALIEAAITSLQKLQEAIANYHAAVRAGLRDSAAPASNRDDVTPLTRTNQAAGRLKEALNKTSPHLENLEHLCNRFIISATNEEIPTGRAISSNNLPQGKSQQLPQAYEI